MDFPRFFPGKFGPGKRSFPWGNAGAGEDRQDLTGCNPWEGSFSSPQKPKGGACNSGHTRPRTRKTPGELQGHCRSYPRFTPGGTLETAPFRASWGRPGRLAPHPVFPGRPETSPYTSVTPGGASGATACSAGVLPSAHQEFPWCSPGRGRGAKLWTA